MNAMMSSVELSEPRMMTTLIRSLCRFDSVFVLARSDAAFPRNVCSPVNTTVAVVSPRATVPLIFA